MAPAILQCVVRGERNLAMAGRVGGHLAQQEIHGRGEDRLLTGSLSLIDARGVDAIGDGLP